MKRLIGLPVIAQGRQVGHVQRAVLRPDGRALAGVVIRDGLRMAKWVEAGSIELLGKLSVLSAGKPARVPKGAGFKLFRVTDADGLRVGVVTDAMLDESTLRVTALEISSGPVDDLIDGRWFALAFDVRAQGSTGHVTIPCRSPGKGDVK